MGTVSWKDMYPGLKGAGVPEDAKSTTINASGPKPATPPTAPVIVLVAIVVMLAAVRIVYEMAPTGGKGL